MEKLKVTESISEAVLQVAQQLRSDLLAASAATPHAMQRDDHLARPAEGVPRADRPGRNCLGLALWPPRAVERFHGWELSQGPSQDPWLHQRDRRRAI